MPRWKRADIDKRDEMLKRWADPKYEGEAGGPPKKPNLKQIAKALGAQFDRSISTRSIHNYVPALLKSRRSGRPMKDRSIQSVGEIWLALLHLTGLSASALFEMLKDTVGADALPSRAGFFNQLKEIKRTLPNKMPAKERSSQDRLHCIRLYPVRVATANGGSCTVLFAYEPTTHFLNAEVYTFEDEADFNIPPENVFELIQDTHARLNLPVNQIWMPKFMAGDNFVEWLLELAYAEKGMRLKDEDPVLLSNAEEGPVLQPAGKMKVTGICAKLRALLRKHNGSNKVSGSVKNRQEHNAAIFGEAAIKEANKAIIHTKSKVELQADALTPYRPAMSRVFEVQVEHESIPAPANRCQLDSHIPPQHQMTPIQRR